MTDTPLVTPSRDALAEALHQAWHSAWPGPSVSLNLYVDSPLWRAQADAVRSLIAAAEARGAARVRETVRAALADNGEDS